MVLSSEKVAEVCKIPALTLPDSSTYLLPEQTSASAELPAPVCGASGEAAMPPCIWGELTVQFMNYLDALLLLFLSPRPFLFYLFKNQVECFVQVGSINSIVWLNNGFCLPFLRVSAPKLQRSRKKLKDTQKKQ